MLIKMSLRFAPNFSVCANFMSVLNISDLKFMWTCQFLKILIHFFFNILHAETQLVVKVKTAQMKS